MIRLLIISTLLLTFLAAEAECTFVPVAETGSEIELMEVSEKLVNQQQINFRKLVGQQYSNFTSEKLSYAILNEAAYSQIITPSIKKNILLMQFVI
ncbi:MAG: hypothetical protein AAFQ94_26655 [Bacteroidota bacterium]